MANKSFESSLKNRHDKSSKKLTAEAMRDLFGAELVRENIEEDEGRFTDGFWDQCYKRVRPLNPNDEPKEIFVESEMKHSKEWGRGYAIQWVDGVPITNGVPFKWPTIDIPFRKAKNKGKIFFLFCMDEDEGLGAYVTRMAMDEAIKKNGGLPKRKIARGEDEGGDYFSVPVSEVKFIERGQNGKWRHFKKQ